MCYDKKNLATLIQPFASRCGEGVKTTEKEGKGRKNICLRSLGPLTC